MLYIFGFIFAGGSLFNQVYMYIYNQNCEVLSSSWGNQLAQVSSEKTKILNRNVFLEARHLTPFPAYEN